MSLEEWNYEEWKKQIEKEDLVALYIYTPMCGTCHVAKKMMQVVEQLRKNTPIGMMNINYSKQLATDFQIESVPCLLISRKNKKIEKVYAFKSVQNLLDKL